MREMFAELLGKVTGCCKGREVLLCILLAPEVGLMGQSSIVTRYNPHAVGGCFSC